MGHHPPPSSAVNPFPPPPSLIPASCCSHVSRIRMRPNEPLPSHFSPHRIQFFFFFFPPLFFLSSFFSFLLSFHARKYTPFSLIEREATLGSVRLFDNSGNAFSSGSGSSWETLRGEEFRIFSGDRARTFPWKVFTRARCLPALCAAKWW